MQCAKFARAYNKRVNWWTDSFWYSLAGGCGNDAEGWVVCDSSIKFNEAQNTPDRALVRPRHCAALNQIVCMNCDSKPNLLSGVEELSHTRNSAPTGAVTIGSPQFSAHLPAVKARCSSWTEYLFINCPNAFGNK